MILDLWHKKESKGIENINTYIYKKDWRQSKWHNNNNNNNNITNNNNIKNNNHNNKRTQSKSRRTQSKRRDKIIKNDNNNKQPPIALLINSLQRNSYLDNYIDCVYEKIITITIIVVIMIFWILLLIIINSIMNKKKSSPKTLTEIKQAKILERNNHEPTPLLTHLHSYSSMCATWFVNTWHYHPPQCRVGLEINQSILSYRLYWLKLQTSCPRHNIPYTALELPNEILCLESTGNAPQKNLI